jgi:hypothetical protein
MGSGAVTVEVRSVSAPPPAAPVTPVVSLMATPNTIAAGGSAVLIWSIQNAVAASISPAPGPLKQSAGQISVSPPSTTTYTLTARSQDGTVATATATVQVMAQRAPVVTPVPVAPPPGPISVNPPGPVTPGASSPLIPVIHDHGGFNQYSWPNCSGALQVVNGVLRYTVTGTTDGRRDNFQVPVSEIREIKPNKLMIRKQPAFHVEIGKQHFNFVPMGMTAAQAAMELERAAGVK